jgi:integrase
MSKAPDGAGSCKQVKTGIKKGKWRAILPADPATGKRQHRYFATEKEGWAWINEQLDRRKQQLATDRAPSIDDLAEQWLTRLARRRKASTVESYRDIYQRYISPRIGKLDVDQTTFDHCQGVLDALEDAGYSVWTIKNVRARLVGLLDYAMRKRRLTYNPARGLDVPEDAQPSKGRALTPHEWTTILKAAEGYRNGAIYYLLLGLGLRPGEALGLRWVDVDWTARTITIRQQVPNKGTPRLTTLKTPSSVRTLPLNDALIARLEAQREAQALDREGAGRNWIEYGLIFTTEHGGPVSQRQLDRQFKSILWRAGIGPKPAARRKASEPKKTGGRTLALVHGGPGITLYDFRRTVATLLGDETDTEERVISAILGHEVKNVTQRYMKTLLTKMRQALETLDQVLRRAA